MSVSDLIYLLCCSVVQCDLWSFSLSCAAMSLLLLMVYKCLIPGLIMGTNTQRGTERVSSASLLLFHLIKIHAISLLNSFCLQIRNLIHGIHFSYNCISTLYYDEEDTCEVAALVNSLTGLSSCFISYTFCVTLVYNKRVNSSRVVQTLDLEVWDSPNLRFCLTFL